jgi:transcriptional regulator with GAF, ATPase, and Fis domain
MTWVCGLDGDPVAGALAGEIAAAATDVRTVTSPDLGDPVGVVVWAAGSPRPPPALRAVTEAGVDVIVVVPGDAAVDPWPVLASGAWDVVTWTGDAAPILARVRRLCDVDRLSRDAAASQGVVGHSRALRQALRELVTAARFGRGPVLILGETGTGKELAARVVHHVACERRPGHLVVVDCGASNNPSLLGSELFGHERGAFTGAVAHRTGACAAADGGTLFLDEVGELALELQPALLRVIQEGSYKRVGSDTWRRSSFRLICATNRQLEQEVSAGRFRADLYHRIAACRVTLPPLSERAEDVTTLFRAFLAEAGADAALELAPAVERALVSRHYPGNLRDLRQLAARVATRHPGSGPVTPGDLPPPDRPVAAPDAERAGDGDPGTRLDEAVRVAVRHGGTLKELRDRVSGIAVAAALEECGGNVRAAAARLGVTDRALHLRRQRASD